MVEVEVSRRYHFESSHQSGSPTKWQSGSAEEVPPIIFSSSTNPKAPVQQNIVEKTTFASTVIVTLTNFDEDDEP